MNREKIFRELYKNDTSRDKYLGSIPVDIRSAFFDNQFVNNLCMERDMLIRMVFGEYADAIEWFLYEWRPGMEVGHDTVVMKIYSIDEYIEYMKINEGFE